MGRFERARGFGAVESAWIDTLPHCVLNTLFVTPHWQRVWYETLGQDGDLLLLCRGERAQGGLAPLFRKDGALSLLGDTDVTDYHEFLIPRGQEEHFYPALADALDHEDWSVLTLTSILDGSPTLDHLPRLAGERGWTVNQEKEDVSPGLTLPETWDDFLAGLSKKDRHELRRKLRRLEKEAGPYEVRRLTPRPEDLGALLPEFLRLMRLSQDEKREFLTPERETFFRSMAEETARRGYLRVFFLEIDQAKVAATICFDYAGQRLLYNSGYDPEYRRLSVGLLLKALCLRDAIATPGITYFDFLRGDEPYKYDLGGVDRVLYRLEVRR